MNRLLLEPGEVGRGGDATITGRRAEHLCRVLKVSVGDTIRTGIVNGPRGMATVDAVSVRPKEGCRVALCVDCSETVTPPRIDLLLALPRPKVMKRLWAQLSAIGVGRIILVNAQRVEKPYFATHWIEEQHYRPLLIEGLEQSGDTRVPEVTIARRFRPCIEDTLADYPLGNRWMAHPGSDEDVPRPDQTTVADAQSLLAVGPEGGWVPFELELLASNGFRPFSLGERTLRTDTACIALLAVLNDRLAG